MTNVSNQNKKDSKDHQKEMNISEAAAIMGSKNTSHEEKSKAAAVLGRKGGKHSHDHDKNKHEEDEGE